MKLIIADDEINICSLIRHLIDWERLGLTLSGMAYDGESAYQLCLQERPDIIITDIQMPGIDGLELVRRLKEELPETRFIIVSGYKYFDYAYRAIQYGVHNFLLKPINGESLNDALRDITLQLRHNTKLGQGQEGITSILRQQFLLQLVHFTLPVLITSGEINQRYGYHLKDGLFHIACIHLSSQKQTEDLISISAARLARQLSDALSPLCADFEILIQSEALTLFLNVQAGEISGFEDRYERCITKALAYLKQDSSIRPFIGLGTFVPSASQLLDSCSAAQKAVDSRYQFPDRMILKGSALQTGHISSELFFQKLNWDGFINGIELLDASLVINRLEQLRNDTSGFLSERPYLFLPWIRYTLQTFFDTLGRCHPQNTSYGELIEQHIQEFSRCFQKSEVFEQVKHIFCNSISQCVQNKSTEDAQMIQIAKQYIASHYQERLSLEDVAAQVYFSPSYFGAQFRQQTGIGFSDYVVGVKLDKAKEFLKGFDMNIKEISEAVGYNDHRYFSKLFQKKVGVKPNEYRKIYHKR